MYLQIHRHIYVQIHGFVCNIFIVFVQYYFHFELFFNISCYCCCYCYYRCFCCRYYCFCNFINSPKSSAIFLLLLLLLYRQQIQSTYIYIVHTDIVVIVFFITLYLTLFALFFVDFLRFSSPFSRSVFHFVFSIHFKLGSYFYTIYVLLQVVNV